MASVSQQSQHELLSYVWKFFGFPGRDGKIFEVDKKKRERVHCKLCSRSYSYVGNTTNMWQHLEECHVEEYHQVKGSGSERISNKSKEKQQMNIGKPVRPHSHFLIHHNHGKR